MRRDRLTFGTKKRAARGLNDALDPKTAPPAGPASAVVNTQPLLVIIRRFRRTAKVKQVVEARVTAVIQRDGAAELDGLGQHRANRAEQTSDLIHGQSARGCAGRNPCAKQGFARVNVPYPR